MRDPGNEVGKRQPYESKPVTIGRVDLKRTSLKIDFISRN